MIHCGCDAIARFVVVQKTTIKHVAETSKITHLLAHFAKHIANDSLVT